MSFRLPKLLLQGSPLLFDELVKELSSHLVLDFKQELEVLLMVGCDELLTHLLIGYRSLQ